MRAAIKQDGGHLGITKDHSPFDEAEVSGDHAVLISNGLRQRPRDTLWMNLLIPVLLPRVCDAQYQV